MWFVAFFMIAAVFGNPEGWCNMPHFMFYYYFTSFNRKGKWFIFSIFLMLTESCPPDYVFQYLNFYQARNFLLSRRFHCCYLRFPKISHCDGQHFMKGSDERKFPT